MQCQDASYRPAGEFQPAQQFALQHPQQCRLLLLQSDPGGARSDVRQLLHAWLGPRNGLHHQRPHVPPHHRPQPGRQPPEQWGSDLQGGKGGPGWVAVPTHLGPNLPPHRRHRLLRQRPGRIKPLHLPPTPGIR